MAKTTVPEQTEDRPRSKRTDELDVGDRIATTAGTGVVVAEVRLVEPGGHGKHSVFARWGGATGDLGMFTADHTWQLATDEPIREAETAETRERIAADLYTLAQLYASGEVPVAAGQTLSIRTDLPDMETLNAVARAVGAEVSTTYGIDTGKLKQYADVSWPAGRRSYEAGVHAEWNAKNPDYVPAQPKTPAK